MGRHMTAITKTVHVYQSLGSKIWPAVLDLSAKASQPQALLPWYWDGAMLPPLSLKPIESTEGGSRFTTWV